MNFLKNYLVGFAVSGLLAFGLFSIVGCILVAFGVYTWLHVITGAIGCGLGTGIVNGFVYADDRD